MQNGSNKNIHEDDAVDKKNLVDLNMDSVEYNRIFYLMNAPSATKDFHRLKVRVSPSPEASTFFPSFVSTETGIMFPVMNVRGFSIQKKYR